MNIRAIIFDMDGTIVDTPYNWKKIREELDTQGMPILSYLDSLKGAERIKKWKILKKHERKATLEAVLKEGIPEFLQFLRRREIKSALVTNNSWKNVSHLMKKFHLKFDYILSRESGLWKPSGAPFLYILEKMGLSAEECCVVGDSHFDIKAAQEAGITRIFFLAKERDEFSSLQAEVVGSVMEIQERIERILDSTA